MTFIIHFKDGTRRQYSNHYDEYDEHQNDAGWDDVYMKFPDADYIEEFQYMIRHKWNVGLRNKLCSLAGEVDSCAAIEGAKLTKQERIEIKESLMKIVNYIDSKI